MAEPHRIRVRPKFKQCRVCSKRLPFTLKHFPANCQHPFGLRARCRVCVNTVRRVEGREYQRRLRVEVLTHYSQGQPACECCGETGFEFLALDHLEGSSRADYRLHDNSLKYLCWIRREGFKAKLRVLCHNCNSCISIRGYCVHCPLNVFAFNRQGSGRKIPPLRPTMKGQKCVKCLRVFPMNAQHFHKNKGMPTGFLRVCIECDRADHTRAKAVRRNRDRLEVFRHYSRGEPRCECCGLDTFEFLTIDHMHGGGKQHRKNLSCVYHWLLKAGLPAGFQVLCFNCNQAKGFYGRCPHVIMG